MENKGRAWSDTRVASAKSRLAGPADVAKLAGGVLVIVLGALFVAEGVSGMASGTTLYFEGVNRGFESLVGLVTIIVGASMIPEKRGSPPAR